MKKKKALTLVTIMMLLLSACSGNNNGKTDTETPPATTIDPTSTIDLGGRSIRISAWWDEKPKGETVQEKQKLEKMAELEQKYNFKFEFINVPFGEYKDKFTTSVLAGEPMADITRLGFTDAIAPVLNDQLLPLSEFTTPDNDINKEQKLVMKLPSLGGEEYSFTTPGVGVVGMHYNRDLFKKLGLPDLQELYNNGEWNWEKFLEVAKQATRDTDNDGNTDIYGYSGWPVDEARHFTVANGVTFVDSTTFEDQSSDPRVIEALEFLNRLHNVEKVTKIKSGNIMDYNETNTFKDGDVAMSIQNDWNIGDVSFEIGVVPVPAGPQSDGVHTFANTALSGWFIPKGVKDPQIVYQIFEEMQDVPTTEEYVGQNGLESNYHTEGDIQIAREKINGTGMVSITDDGIPNYPYYKILEDIFLNNQSVTATLEKYKAQAQDAVNKLKN
ncbi:ABC transporter substrate-binding protein [Paenibacillus urinalis]|uniref:ABC transporter substrate-binding protein n=2 Tax=Bacillati TaxID=1783272 RepID=UPI00195F7A88